MAQSFTRKIKRLNLVPVWNKVTFRFDFYKRIKSLGMYALTPNPYSNNPVITGKYFTYERLLALQKNSEYTPEEKKHYEKMMKEIKKQSQPEEPGFFKSMFGKLFGKK